MFENKTFENILNDMLNDVATKNPELDTRTGSIIYTALAPIALELETAYHEMDMILNETFLETASREYLAKHGDQLGLTINEATYGHYRGEFNVDVPLGSRFNLDKFNYYVYQKIADPVEKDDPYVFELICETAGSEPNNYYGALTPITYVANLAYAEIPPFTPDEAILPGEDEEDTEAFRYRLQTHAKKPPVNGNLAQYHEWLDEYEGIGKYKVIPLGNGANTIKILVLDTEGGLIEDLSEIQDYFDPDATGMGDGVAPIGAMVTVASPYTIPVSIDCKVRLKDGYGEGDLVDIQNALLDYFKSIAFDKTTIDYMPIAAKIYNVPCVGDIVRLEVIIFDGQSYTNMSLDNPAEGFTYTLPNDTVATLSVHDITLEVVSNE